MVPVAKPAATHGVSASPRDTAARHGKLRHSSALRNAFKVLGSAVLAVAVSGVAVAAYAMWALTQVETVALGNDGPTVGIGARTLDGAVNVLLVGSDSRQGQSIDDGEQGELNDVTMLLHVAEDHQSATVISFPRDLMLPIPSCTGPNGEPQYYPAMSEQQLNSTLGYGLPCTVDTIEELTGLEIPYAGVITFDGVINMSNAIGGVDVCLTEPIVDPKTDLDLPAGDVTLVGTDALQFLRTRYGVGDGGDTSRISNQQVFMAALMRKVKDDAILTDPVKVYGLGKAAVENMTLSDSMANVGFMQAVAGIVREVDLDSITFVQYPSLSHPYESSRLVPDPYAGPLLMERILSGEPIGDLQAGAAVAEDPQTTDGGSESGETTSSADPSAETEAPAEPAPAETSDTGGTVTGAEGDANGDGVGGSEAPETLPQNVTGQRASKITCSAGRVTY